MILNKSVFSGRSDWPNLQGAAAINRTQFGQSGETGKSYWKSVSWSCRNPTLEDHTWSWSASSGELPDQYQRDRLIQIHGNTPEPGPDHGYSTWIMLDDGRIFLADYTNFGDVPPHLPLGRRISGAGRSEIGPVCQSVSLSSCATTVSSVS